MEDDKIPPVLHVRGSLSHDAKEFAQALPPFTKGQLLYYSQQKGRVSQADVDAVLGGDSIAHTEYDMLRSVPGRKIGDAVFHVVLQAYQPPVNRNVIVSQSSYSIVDSTVVGDPFIDRVREMVESMLPPKNKWRLMSTVLGNAVQHNVLPIMAMGEVLHERGIESSLTVTFPEVYFRNLKWYFPDLYNRLKEDNRKGALDVGISNSHHSIAPLADPKYVNPPVYTREDLKRQYMRSLKYYLADFSTSDGRVSLHVPEQATTPLLFDVLSEVEAEGKVKFSICLDSRYHNSGVDLSAATRVNPRMDPNLVAFFRGYNLSDNLAFHTVGGGDPLTFEQRSSGDIRGLIPQQENMWFNIEGARIFRTVTSDLFGVDLNQRTWREPIYGGENSVLTLALDAEWAGYHNRGVPVAMYRALSALSEFSVRVASTREAFKSSRLKDAEAPPRDASWSGDFGLWINPGTEWLIRSTGKVLEAYRGPLDTLSKIFRDPADMPMHLKVAWEHYDRSMISCPYWWSCNQPNFPRDVPVIFELYRNMTSSGAHILRSQEQIVREREKFSLSDRQVDEILRQRTELAQAYESFLNDGQARRYPELAEILDAAKHRWEGRKR